jgi:diguanylate cyclase (GGDEF)-like protein
VRIANDAIRFGGDEFVLILENIGVEEAYRIAERVRSCAGELEFAGGESVFRITLSIGLIEGAAPLDALLEKADRAMYASKNKGKNKTTVFAEGETDGAFHMSLS